MFHARARALIQMSQSHDTFKSHNRIVVKLKDRDQLWISLHAPSRNKCQEVQNASTYLSRAFTQVTVPLATFDISKHSL